LFLVSGRILWLTVAAKFAEASLFSFAEYPRWVRYLMYGAVAVIGVQDRLMMAAPVDRPAGSSGWRR